MSSSVPDALHDRVRNHLAPHGRTGLRARLSGVIDLEALENQQYEDVLEAVDHRLSTVRYSMISMLVAGIYFGLVIGTWLVGFSSWAALVQWAVPTAMVTVYAVYSTHQSLGELYHLSAARALLQVLVNRPVSARSST